MNLPPRWMDYVRPMKREVTIMLVVWRRSPSFVKCDCRSSLGKARIFGLDIHCSPGRGEETKAKAKRIRKLGLL